MSFVNIVIQTKFWANDTTGNEWVNRSTTQRPEENPKAKLLSWYFDKNSEIAKFSP